jgi:two-component system, LuxR family, sensor kinase FixL
VTVIDTGLRAFLDAAVEGIISINEKCVIETINPSAQRMFGYGLAEVTGQNVSILMPSPYREEHDSYVARYLATGVKHVIGIGREVVGLRKDGSEFPIDLSVAEARLGDRRVFMGTIRDITERRQAEVALNNSHRDLERALAELREKTAETRTMTQQLWQAAKLASVGELAASIAHELNNPLATVALRVESMLARTPADDPRRRSLEIVAQESKRMADLVSNLLQFCRRGAEQSSTVDVRQEITNALELVHHHLRKREISVTEELDPNTPTIFADRQKLRQVFLNLLTNACDAMLTGGTLKLRASPTSLASGKPGVVLEFSDTGGGIPAEFLDRVMEPFFSTKEEGKGTGLGLAICKRIVHEHHGVIQIQSEVGQGTTVRIVLPVKNGMNQESLTRAERRVI